MSAIEEIGKKAVIDMTDLEYAVWNLHTTESGDIGEHAAIELVSIQNLANKAGELNATLQARIAELEKYMFAFFDLMDGNDASDVHYQTGFSREYCEKITSLFNCASKEDKAAWSKRTNS